MKIFFALLAFFDTAALLAAALPPPAVSAVAYHPRVDLLAAGTHGKVYLIKPATNEIVRELDDFRGRITAIAFSSQGNVLAVASGEPGKSGTIRTFKLVKEDLVPLDDMPGGHRDIVYTLAFSPDDKTLASAGYDRVIKLWDMTGEADPLTLADHSDTVYAVSFNKNGKLLASASADRAVKVWDTDTGKRLYTLSDCTDYVYAAAWSPDGKHLAAGGVDRSIRVWQGDAAGGKLIHSVFAHTQPVSRLLYTADGLALYSLSEGAVIKKWDAATLKEKATFPTQPDTTYCLALSPDQKQLAAGRHDGALVLLDASTGKQLSQLLPVAPKAPEVLKLTPDFGLRGGAVHVAVDGRHLGSVNEVHVGPDGSGVQARLLAEERTSNRVEIELVIPAAQPAGVITFTLKGAAGQSNPLPFVIDRYPVVQETGLSDSPRIGKLIKLPATLAGTLGKAGDADYYRFRAAAGQEVAAQVVSAGSGLESVLELTNESGQTLAESYSGLVGYTIPKDGIYALGIHDREFRGSPAHNYRISVGSFPAITGVTPLSVERGRQALLRVHGVNLPAQQIPFTAPADATPGARLAIPMPAAAEKAVGQAQVVVGAYPEVNVEDNRAFIATPGTATGVIAKPGAAQAVEFAAKKGERLIVEVEASRLGSPLDSAIEIVDANDEPVPQATLRCVARTFTVFRDNDSAASGIRLDSWNDLAIDDYLYADGEVMRINQLPKNPDDDCQFYQVGGQRSAYLGTMPTHHAMGSALYKVEIHPPGKSFPPNGLPVVNLFYRNDDGGPGYGKDSRIFFDPPADGRYRVRIRDAAGHGGDRYAYRLTVRPPQPDFSISLKPGAPAIWKGGAVQLTVTADRRDGFDGRIDLTPIGLPPGLNAPASFIEAGQTSAVIPIHATSTAPAIPGGTAWKIKARAANGEEHEAAGGNLSLLEPGDIVAATDLARVVILPGQVTKLRVTVERANGFAGRIPVDVRGLPHGVRVLNIGLNGILITERETQREVTLYAEPWVKPMERPFIVICSREGKNTEYGAPPVVLEVMPK